MVANNNFDSNLQPEIFYIIFGIRELENGFFRLNSKSIYLRPLYLTYTQRK